MQTRIGAAAGALALALTACTRGEGDSGPVPAFAGIGADETVTALGTEPFWSLTVTGGEAVYATPGNQDGTRFAVERFAGNSGIAVSGEMAGTAFDATITRGTCSDGMSDRSYPYTVTLLIGEEQRQGCAFTSREPATGPARP